MFPLDALDAWPRFYGSRGFFQYQLVVPRGAEDALSAVIEVLRRFGVPCYLAVLKDFGPANEAPCSFPIEGWTLALDVPRAVDVVRNVASRFRAHEIGPRDDEGRRFDLRQDVADVGGLYQSPELG